MHDARDPKQIVTYLAETRPHHQAGRPRPTCAWTRATSCAASRTRRRRRSSPSSAMRWTPTSSSSAADQTAVIRPRQRYTDELLSPDPNDPVYKANPGSFASELHERFASPLYAFAFVLVVLAFMGQAQTTRTSRMQAVIAAFAVAVLAASSASPAPTWWSCARPWRPCSMRCPPGRAAGRDCDPMAALPAAALEARARRSRGLLEAAGRSAGCCGRRRLMPARAARARG